MLAGDTPLIDAARHGRVGDVVTLLADGADVNKPASDGSGWTALLLACARGHTNVVKTLLAANAGRFPVHLESGESVLIKMMNLVAIGD